MTQFFLAERPYHTFFRDPENPHTVRWAANLPVENEDRAPDVTQKKGPHRISKKCLTSSADGRRTLNVTKQLTLDEVIALMRKRQGDRSQRDYAAELGISEQFLCDIYKGHRTPGDKALSSLGLTQLMTYVPKNGKRTA